MTAVARKPDATLPALSGIGLRPAHYRDMLAWRPPLDTLLGEAVRANTILEADSHARCIAA